MKRSALHAQRGMTLITVCLLLFALLAIAAICIDLGILYTARTSAQHAADAGALAGAYTFRTPTMVQPTAAKQAAVAITNLNQILKDPVTITADDVLVNSELRRVTVTVSRSTSNPINTFFAKALGIAGVPLEVHATAELSPYSAGTRCVKPVFIPNTIFMSASSSTAACTSNQILFDPNNPGNLASYSQNAQGTFKFTGQCLPIRPTTPSNALAPGEFFSLDFGYGRGGASNGASTYRQVWSDCLNNIPGVNPAVVEVGTQIHLQTGNMQGPTNQGVSDLIGNPPDVWCGLDSTGQYTFGSSNCTSTSYTSKQLAVVPVWNDCDPSEAVTPGSAGPVTVIGFVQVFVDGSNQPASCPAAPGGGNWVWTHVVNAVSSPSGSGSGTGPLAVPVRLVNP